MKKIKTIAIIPARGGSKRISKKNIRDFLGSPIIKYSIDAAINSKCFDEVMVSTDDQEIAKVAKSIGAKIPFMRSTKNSADKSTLADVILEVLKEYKKIDKLFDNICCILPTAPFVTGCTLKKAFEVFERSDANALIPVVSYSYPIQRAFRKRNDKLELIWPENEKINSQDIETTYHDCGQFYLLKTASFLKEKRIFAKDSVPFILNESEVQDIDNEEDWRIAELKYKIQKQV